MGELCFGIKQGLVCVVCSVRGAAQPSPAIKAKAVTFSSVSRRLSLQGGRQHAAGRAKSFRSSCPAAPLEEGGEGFSFASPWLTKPIGAGCTWRSRSNSQFWGEFSPGTDDNVTGSGTDLPGWFGSTELCILAVTLVRGVLASC